MVFPQTRLNRFVEEIISLGGAAKNQMRRSRSKVFAKCAAKRSQSSPAVRQEHSALIVAAWPGGRITLWSYIKRKCWYLLLLVVSSWFVYQNRVVVLNFEFENFNSISLVFILWLVLLMLPLFSEMELFGVKLKKEVEKNRAEVKDSINELKTQMLDLRISNTLANSQSISIYTSQLPTDKEVKETLADVAKTPRQGIEQEKQSIDDFVSETSIYLFKVRFTLEKILSALCEKLSYSGIPNTNRMLTYVLKSGLIDKKIADYISQVNAICNRGIHGEIISDEYIQLVEALLPKILSELNSITSRFGYKHYFVCPRCKFSAYSDCENECPVCKFVSEEY